MNDKELADKVMVLGVGQVLEESDWINEKGDYTIGGNAGSAKWFVRDWRVAGALMERCESIEIRHCGDNDDNWQALAYSELHILKEGQDNSLSHTIIEACVEALGEKK